MRRMLLVAAVTMVLGCGDDESATPQQDAAVTQDAGQSDGPVSYDFGPVHDYLFAGSWSTDGVVVLLRGEIIYEEYAHGFTASMRHILYSASKSVGSALVGIAVDEGLMRLEDSVCTYLTPPVAADATFCDITIEHLIHMSSGLAWNENYDDPDTSNVLQMLYGDVTDMGLYTATQPRVAPAGTLWNYSSGEANLLARALRAALGAQDMRAWAKEKLFDPAGLSAVFETDRSGTLVFSSSCFMTPRDMARFGQLYLHDGVLDGTRVLPEGWVAYSITPAPSRATPQPRDPNAGPGDSGGSYGAYFWLNATSLDAPEDTWAYPQAPPDTYSAEGHWGQDIFVVPSLELVVVRVGDDRLTMFDSGVNMGLIIDAIKGGGN
jgi:CubicO group peptidase (beta-lactamase class C family)